MRVALLAAAAFFTGCSTPAPVADNTVIGADLPAPTAAQRGRIIAVEDVVISDNPSNGRSGTGNALGTALGVLTGNVRAVAGGVSNTIEGLRPGQAAEQITIALDEGRTIMIVQARTSPPLAPGERVVITKTVTSAGLPTNVNIVVRDPQGRPR